MLFKKINLLLKKIILPTLLIILLASTNIDAQNTPLLDIEEIVVTSTKKNTTLQETPVSVSVIQMEDIRKYIDIKFLKKLDSDIDSQKNNLSKFIIDQHSLKPTPVNSLSFLMFSSKSLFDI